MLRRLLVAWLAAVSLVLPAAARTATPDTRTVSAVGEAPITGSVETARQQAINQALRQAVEQSVGVFVSSQTQVQNFQVLTDSIYTKADGFVGDRRVVDEHQNDGTYWVKVEATVSVLPLASQLKALGILRQWTIATVLQGKGYNRTALEAAETAINRRLVDAGFKTADKDTVLALDDAKLAAELAAGQVARVLPRLRDAGVDVLVLGRAAHERTAGTTVETYGGMRVDLTTVRARLEIKAVRADTGEIVAADVFEDKAIGAGADTVSAQAVEKAGSAGGDFLVGEIIKLPAATSAPVRLTVKGLTFARARAFLQAVQGVQGVRKVHQERFTNGQAVFEVDFEGKAELLADALTAAVSLKAFHLDITNLSGGRIDAGAR